MSLERYEIATIDGDGIGPEVCQATVRVLKEACGVARLDFIELPAGASHYRSSGEEAAVEGGLREGEAEPRDLGGSAGCRQMTDAICRRL